MSDALPSINIISGLDLTPDAIRIPSVVAKVIRNVPPPQTTKIIGGDSEDLKNVTPPAVIIEKTGDRITKILVKCPCGRHSELALEYPNDAGN